jgi:hypothetical protein
MSAFACLRVRMILNEVACPCEALHAVLGVFDFVCVDPWLFSWCPQSQSSSWGHKRWSLGMISTRSFLETNGHALKVPWMPQLTFFPGYLNVWPFSRLQGQGEGQTRQNIFEFHAQFLFAPNLFLFLEFSPLMLIPLDRS